MVKVCGDSVRKLSFMDRLNAVSVGNGSRAEED